MRRLTALAVLFSLIAACTGGEVIEPTTSSNTTGTTSTTSTTMAEPTTPQTADEAGLAWWNDRVFYEIFVRSFKDSDGDGVGDFTGLTASLDYLNDGDPTTTTDLGVTGIWLMPIFPSPSYHGYDVVDYRDVNPDYGTMDEFRTFLGAAHERGISVIIDLVINHSGRDHPWFEASRSGDAAYADWYLWSETDPATTGPWGQQVWHAAGDRYYFGLFWEGMPDLNLENPDVTAELHDVARFWLEDVGVDGFRLDAAKHLIEDGAVMSDTAATVDWLVEFNEIVHGIAPDAMILGEVWSPTLNIAEYIPDALDLAFEFALSEAGGSAVSALDAGVLLAAQERVLGAYPENQYAVFLTNHDMDRIMSAVGGNTDVAKLAATWLLTSPGVPFIYYGEEVGLQGTKPDERIRTPMPWTAEGPGVGFTDGVPWEAADSGFTEFNVAAEDADPGSLLNHYRALVQFRADSPGLRYGSVIDVETGSSRLFAYLRSIGDDHVLVVGNLGATAIQDYALDLASGPLHGMKGVVSVVGPAAQAPVVSERGGFLDYQPVDIIPGYGALVMRFTPDEQPPPPTITTSSTTATTLPPATEADAALVEQFIAAGEAWSDYVAPDARVRAEGQTIGLFEPLPELAISDWDGDGTVTIADAVELAVAVAARLASAEVTCVPSGPEVVCSGTEGDLFYELAGETGPSYMQSYIVKDGMISEIAAPEYSFVPDFDRVEEAWVEQFVAFEQWVYDTHSDQYQELFTGPCCTGDRMGLIIEPDTVDAYEALLAEWTAR